MPPIDLDLNPTAHITADALGSPGKRVFYIQGWQEDASRPVSILIEKIQLQSLVLGIEKLLENVARQFPNLTPPEGDYAEEKMRILPPVDPLFRAGELGLGYDAESDRIVLLAREIEAEGEPPEKTGVVRFWCTRPQARRLAAWSSAVIQRGRPICPQCGAALEPEGHFCPKKNGRKH